MMEKLNIEYSAVTITAVIFVLSVGIIFPFSSAIAEPVDLNGTIPLGAGSISGILHGDLTNNILTLNSPPSSKISIETAASGPLSPSILPGSLTYTQDFIVELPFGNTDSVSYNVEFTITPHLSASLEVPTWLFSVSGKANLEIGTTSFIATPQSPSTIGTINATSTPTFSGRITTSLDPVAAALAQASLNTTLAELNSSGAKINLSLVGMWEKVSIGLATIALAQTEPNIKIDLGLTSTVLAGKIDYRVDLSFKSPANGFVGNLFEEEIEKLIEVELMNYLLNYVDNELDREVNDKMGKYKQDCSGQKLGLTRINIFCDLNAQLALVP